ncbi:CAP domain-containing protein [Streptomyces sp. FXJ1.172]|uniref:CAP domain-containing protein n=1 Tax=Streptomyces sp. FXJ1.172 TaxID=710705 RepID=UPI000B0A15BF|nr:CAP domain-containing protein [Streptomyces sp. FXJ1.172]WEO99270.1 CAP domain-containing protein [Streptomyces sp. FXJ1.172]
MLGVVRGVTRELVPGGNAPLPEGPLRLRVAGPFDVSALVTGADGRVGCDADFVFYNQPRAAGVRLLGDTLAVEPGRLRGGACRVTVVVSAAESGTPLGRLPAPRLEVTDPHGSVVARFVPPRLGPESVLLVAELYLRPGAGWKLRAIGQGYADGLAGLARDFGVDVTDDGGQSGAAAAAGPSPEPPSPTDDGFLRLVNSARAQTGSPRVTLDARLLSAARSHARAMADAGRLGGEGRDGVSVHQRITGAGYPYITVGEHLVSGPRTAADFVEYCLGAERSRAILLDPGFAHAALAHADAGDRYWTALWAAPLTPDALSRTAAEAVALTNGERRRAGLPPLAVDPLLTAAAQAHCADMVARDFYDHTCPDGSRPWDRAAAAGSRRRTIGENIACGQRSPAEVVTGWMNSPGHRANILKREFGHIGVGFAGGGRAGTYWCQLFGG